MGLDGLDTAILNRIQAGFLVVEKPYDEIGKAIGLSGAEVLKRVIRLKHAGVIRKVGPFFDPLKLGHSSTLCALDVPEERLEQTAAMINRYKEVTHNYLREGSPNLWFTVIACSTDDIDRILEEIAEKTGTGPVRNLRAQKIFKVKVDLRVGAL
ncbi:MAG: Lrp/AsnC family transcriptional regulator [Deltaproteobacteria bacterium]|nr:Lrp/AsnC family transcriptional regulator [Deltaproteobacteria bacterium]